MTTREKRQIIILVTIIVLLILSLLYYFFIASSTTDKTETDKSSPEQTQEATETQDTTQDSSQSEEEVETVKYDPEQEENRELTQGDLKSLAFSFAERFGSYSNQANFSNLKDLKLYMTEDMKDWTDNYIKEKNKEEYSGEYYGITTKAITGQVNNFDPETGEAEVVVTTQRRENNPQGEDEVFTQKVTIKFQQVSGEWKVNDASWQ